ncbi:MAG TPA: DUF2188 domain-containing protein [Thermomicrobiales bacterium]|nr:DUF2188 domain-containing protein [Thermomicrobiales bacterium]
MAAAHDLHVIPGIVGWHIAATPGAEPLALTRTRDEAVALALRMEYEDPDAGKVLIHGPGGEVRERVIIDRTRLFPLRDQR